MKNLAYIVLFIVFLAGCQSPAGPGGNNPEGLNQDSTATTMNNGIAVKVQKLNFQKFQHFIEINGSVRAEKDAIVSPEIMGQIKNIHVKEGDFVKKGQLLVTLNTSVTESSINEVRISLGLARETFKKQKELWDQNIGTEMQYLQAKNNVESLESRLKTLQAQANMAKLKAPFDGIVDKISMKIGELASAGREVLHLINLSEMKVYGEVSESYLPYIHEGDWTEISFPIYDGLKVDSKIHRVGQVIDEKSRTFRIEIKLENKEFKLKPNMISKVRLNDFTDEKALVVPSYIIKQDFNGSFLYVAEMNGSKRIAKKTYVTPGITYNNQTMVISGLSKDQEVIIVGYNLVSGGAEINLVGASS